MTIGFWVVYILTLAYTLYATWQDYQDPHLSMEYDSGQWKSFKQLFMAATILAIVMDLFPLILLCWLVGNFPTVMIVRHALISLMIFELVDMFWYVPVLYHNTVHGISDGTHFQRVLYRVFSLIELVLFLFAGVAAM